MAAPPGAAGDTAAAGDDKDKDATVSGEFRVKPHPLNTKSGGAREYAAHVQSWRCADIGFACWLLLPPRVNRCYHPAFVSAGLDTVAQLDMRRRFTESRYRGCRPEPEF